MIVYKQREVGTMRKCSCCKKCKDETFFSFAKVKGYNCYCKECANAKAKAKREKDKAELWNQLNAVRHELSAVASGRKKKSTMFDFEPDKQDIAFSYRQELEELPRIIKQGDIYKVDGRKARVEKLYPTYVLFMYHGGAFESFGYDDVYKIKNGTFKRD